jgi:hypothetical protein
MGADVNFCFRMLKASLHSVVQCHSCCHAHAATPDAPMPLAPIPTFWANSNVLDLFQHLGPIPTLRIHSNVLGSFQCFGTNPTIPLPLIQHLQCVPFLRRISEPLDFLPIVLSPFGLVVKFLFFLFHSNYVPFVSQRPPNVYYSLLLSCWTSISVTTSQPQYLSDLIVLSYLSLNIDLDFYHSPSLSLPTSSSGLCGRVSAKA